MFLSWYGLGCCIVTLVTALECTCAGSAGWSGLFRVIDESLRLSRLAAQPYWIAAGPAIEKDSGNILVNLLYKASDGPLYSGAHSRSTALLI